MGFLGCSPPETVSAPKTADDVKRALVEAMIQADHCYLGNLDYAVRDPDFLDQVLQKLLGSETLQQLAGDPYEFQMMKRFAANYYSIQMETDDGLTRLARVVADRFAHPVITVQGQNVRADYGHIAAKFTRSIRHPVGISFGDSPHLNASREWQSPEVAAALKDLLDKHPDAALVEVRVLIPGGLQTPEWIYSYRPLNDRVLVTLPTPPLRSYYTDHLNHDFGPYLRGEVSLDTQKIHSSGAK
jgi:hypothetical protein